MRSMLQVGLADQFAAELRGDLAERDACIGIGRGGLTWPRAAR